MLRARYDRFFRRSQTLAQHCLNVAQKTEESMRPFGLPALGRLTGLLHDICKSQPAWQRALEGERARFQTGEGYVHKPLNVPHGPPGARTLHALLGSSSDSPAAVAALQMVCLAIAAHHGYLMDVVAPDGEQRYLRLLEDSAPEDMSGLPEFFREVASLDAIAALFRQAADELGRALQRMRFSTAHIKAGDKSTIQGVLRFLAGLLQRVLYSALIDADRLDAANFEEEILNVQPELPAPDWQALLRALLARLSGMNQQGAVNAVRRDISDACDQAALWEDVLLALHAPTGGGKTLASLRYALRRAKEKCRRRIFYVVSYTTILDQVFGEYQKTFSGCPDAPRILLHHSNLIPDNADAHDGSGSRGEEEMLALAERWDADIILTTHVQFFNALYLGTGRAARRLRALHDSVILFDEVQTIPPHLTHLFNLAVLFLNHVCGCDVVLSSATQPTLHTLQYPIPEPRSMFHAADNLFERMRRVTLHDDRALGAMDARQLAAYALDKQQLWNSVLLVLNTRAAARKAYDALAESKPPHVRLHLLSNDLCPAHRRRIIASLEHAQDEPVICVSTQLIECGVDLSFGCALRSLAGADNIWQTAGRCNRHGDGRLHPVFVIRAGDENLTRLPEIRKAQDACTQTILDLRGDINGLQQPSHMASYYQYLFPKNAALLSFNVAYKGLHTTLVDLLSVNDKGVQSLTENGKAKPAWLLLQAFGTAGAAFEVIPENTEALLVPYEGGAEIILALNAAPTPRQERALLREAQLYAINIYKHVRQNLEQDGAIFALPCGVLALRPEWYDAAARGLLEAPYYDPRATIV